MASTSFLARANVNLCLSDFETQVSKREMVTVAAGTDVLQSFVYSQMPVTSVLSKVASTIISAGWTESPVERRPVVVDLSTYRPEQHFSRSMHDKYRLLDYIQHNWTRHATALTSLASSWDKLQDLIFERFFMFDIRPWDIDVYKQGGTISQLPYLPMFRWAIDEGLTMYVKLLEDPPTGSTIGTTTPTRLQRELIHSSGLQKVAMSIYLLISCRCSN